ncbi:MAG: cellulase family glycosylhydrolase [Defluviitaleaceae bacterium]|nr:cellulase family glycosylhydrolase [Defluviitaleaceae bacterium]
MKKAMVFVLVFVLLFNSLPVSGFQGEENAAVSGSNETGLVFCLQSYLDGFNNLPREFAEADSPIAPTHAPAQVTVTARQGTENKYLEVNRIITDNRTRGPRLRMEFVPGDIIRVEGQLTGTTAANFRFQAEPSPNSEIGSSAVTVQPGERFILTHTVTASDNSGTPLNGMRIITQTVGATSFIIDSWTVNRVDQTVAPEGYVFHLQSYIADMPLGNIGTGTTHLAPTHTTSEVTVQIQEASGGLRRLFVNRTASNTTRGLLLRNVDFELGDILTITGRLVTGSGTNMRLQMDGRTGYMPGSVSGGAVGSSFTITYRVSADLMELTNKNIRIIAHGNAVPATVQIDDITVFRPDNTIPTVTVQNPAMNGSFVIANPYSAVNWNNWYQFRTSQHVHTLRSDGSAYTREMIVEYYNRGYDILAVTDHNVIESGDWTQAPPNPTIHWWSPMRWNDSQNQMSAADQTAIRNGTWTPGGSRVLPDSRFTSEHGWFRPEMRERLGLPPGQPNIGMISVPFSNEQSGGHHMLTYWANFNARESDSDNTIIRSVQDLGGLVVLAHPGRHTCSRSTRCSASERGEMCDHAGGRGLAAASNLPREVTRYVNWLRQFPAVMGMEIYNRPDHETRTDRILWDNVLMQLMPEKRNVWGFANDDAHSMDGTSLGWNVMLMPSLTSDNYRTSMENGAFYFVCRVDRQLGVNENVSNSASSSWHRPLMAAPAPTITNISVSGQKITIEGKNYDDIIWVTGNPFRMGGNNAVGGGVVIETGNTIDLSMTGKYIWGNYVRAVLINRQGIGSGINGHGVALTQPFGVYLCEECGGVVCCDVCGGECSIGCEAAFCSWVGIDPSITAAQVVAGIRAGWNLGNTFDARSHSETAWLSNMDNLATTRANIEAIHAAGFNAIRIPVTWTLDNGSTGQKATSANNWTISPAFLNRVETVVRWAYDLGMTVIINSHHEDAIQLIMNSNPTISDYIHERIWQQVAGHFNNQFGHRLIFAGSNEPRTDLDDFGDGTHAHAAINRQHQLFVDTVRATGGNNAKRSLIIIPHAASARPGALAGLTLPTDPERPGDSSRFILEVHTYTPFGFTFLPRDGGSGHTTSWTTTGSGHGGPSEITTAFNAIQTRAQQLGVPVILGEWGSQNKENTAARERHAEYYVQQAASRGWATFWWDNAHYEDLGTNQMFGLLDRRDNTWFFPTIVAAIMRGAGDSDQIAVNTAANNLTWDSISNGQAVSNVTASLSLPTTADGGVTITWASSNSAISNTGVVTRPATVNSAGNIVATLRVGTAEATRTFSPVVTALVAAPTVTFSPASVTINDTSLTQAVSVGGTATGSISVSAAIPSALQDNVAVEWTAASPTITIKATRPTANIPPLTGSFNVSVTRQGVTQTFAVNVSLTTTWVAPLYQIGDVDGDGWLTSVDMVIIARFVLGEFAAIPSHFTHSPAWQRTADVDCSGVVDKDDVTRLFRYLLGTYSTLCPHGGCGVCEG